MSIWFKEPRLEQLLRQAKGTLVEHLGICVTEVGDDYLQATMPVDERTVQPLGLLHGGASLALAETLGSVAANLVVDPSRYACVGLEINGNHIRAVRQGHVTATARPVHIGRSTHVWQIEILDDQERLACLSRITMSVLDRHS